MKTGTGTRTYDNYPGVGIVITADEWCNAVADGIFTSNEVRAFWMLDGRSSMDSVYLTPQKDATHVVMYAKR